MKSFKNLLETILFRLGYVPKQDPSSFSSTYFHPIDMVSFTAEQHFLEMPTSNELKHFKASLKNELICKAFDGKITSYEWIERSGNPVLKMTVTAILPRIKNPMK